jgi:hypothetical protein
MYCASCVQSGKKRFALLIVLQKKDGCQLAEITIFSRAEKIVIWDIDKKSGFLSISCLSPRVSGREFYG